MRINIVTGERRKAQLVAGSEWESRDKNTPKGEECEESRSGYIQDGNVTQDPVDLQEAPPSGEPLDVNLDVLYEPWDTDLLAMEIPHSVNGYGCTPNDLQLSLALPEPTGEADDAFMNSSFIASTIPMDSYVRVQRYSFHAACLENAAVLGVAFSQIKDHKCGYDRLVSPWVSQSTQITPEDTVVPDLSPGEAQKRHDHDLYIDCLPFRDFREKLLALRSVEPKIFDEQDFIKDLDYRGAMQCWGPTPWENKSWEVQIWFLNKWWKITGGENGEMGTTSRWWRMFRGELD